MSTLVNVGPAIAVGVLALVALTIASPISFDDPPINQTLSTSLTQAPPPAASPQRAGFAAAVTKVIAEQLAASRTVPVIEERLSKWLSKKASARRTVAIQYSQHISTEAARASLANTVMEIITPARIAKLATPVSPKDFDALFQPDRMQEALRRTFSELLATKDFVTPMEFTELDPRDIEKETQLSTTLAEHLTKGLESLRTNAYEAIKPLERPDELARIVQMIEGASRERAVQISWAVTAFLFTLSVLHALFTSASAIFQSVSTPSITPSWARSVGLVLAATGVATAVVFLSAGERIGPGIWGSILATVSVKRAPGIVSAANVLNAMTVLGSGFLLAGISAVLSMRTMRTSARIQMRILRSILLAGAILLVAGVVEVGALYRWATLPLTGRWPETASATANSMTLIAAVFFTSALIVVYGTALRVIKARAEVLRDDTAQFPTEAEFTSWLATDVNQGVPQEFSNATLALTPLVAGFPLSYVLGLVSLS